MANKVLYLLAWVLFLPATFTFIIILGLPMFLFKGVNTFLWLHNYVDYICGVNDKLELNKKPDYYQY